MPPGANDEAEEPAYDTRGVDATRYDRYASIRLEDEAVLIYDREEEGAWFQSRSAIGLEFVR